MKCFIIPNEFLPFVFHSPINDIKINTLLHKYSFYVVYAFKNKDLLDVFSSWVHGEIKPNGELSGLEQNQQQR